MALGNLFVAIRASADEWSADIKKIEREARALEKSLKPAQQAAEGIGLSLLAVSGAILGGTAVLVKQIADVGDEMKDMSERTALSVEELSRLGYAAEQSGSSLEGIGAAMTKLSRTVVEAAQGSKEQAAAFKQIGVSVQDASGALRPMND